MISAVDPAYDLLATSLRLYREENIPRSSVPIHESSAREKTTEAIALEVTLRHIRVDLAQPRVSIGQRVQPTTEVAGASTSIETTTAVLEERERVDGGLVPTGAVSSHATGAGSAGGQTTLGKRVRKRGISERAARLRRKTENPAA